MFEHNNLTLQGSEAGGPDNLVPLGVRDVKAVGGDVTLVAIAGAMSRALDAATRLAEDGIISLAFGDETSPAGPFMSVTTLSLPRLRCRCSWCRRARRCRGAGSAVRPVRHLIFPQ